jgi:hypothetical protein
VSVMNKTKWKELRIAVQQDLPFSPAFQRKDLTRSEAWPEDFDHDTPYSGDWPSGTDRSSEIEYIRVRPRRTVSRGALIPDGIEDIEEQFLGILNRLRIPYIRDSETVTIYGYIAHSGDLQIP